MADTDSERSLTFSDSSYDSAVENLSANEANELDMLESVEPVATDEQHVEYLEQVAAEEAQEREFNKRFTGEVPIESWCSCSHCSLDLATKPAECFCCNEMPRCQEKMFDVDLEDECITEHPGFSNVCLDKWVLETAAIGLKTRRNRSYAVIYRERKKSESQFLRSVAYRQIVRFIWSYMGNSMRVPLPSCIYTAIRRAFPSENGNYKGFEEEEEEDQAQEEDVNMSEASTV